MKRTWNITKEEKGKVHSVEQVPTLLVNNEKLKDSTDVASVLNNFFNNYWRNVQQIRRGAAMSTLKD